MGQRSSLPAEAEKPSDGMAWWFKLLVKGVAIIGSGIGMILGIYVCMTFHALCLVAGIIQICSGFLIILFEAPCCCQCLDFINQLGAFADNRPHWQKATLYGGISLLPMFFCFEMSTVFGSGLMFVTAVLYGIMALGKKADRTTMLQRASASLEMEEKLMGNQESERSDFLSDAKNLTEVKSQS